MTISELKQKIQNEVVSFQFQKKDGTIRDARGTTKMEIIPEENHPTGGAKTLSDDVVRFYDMDKGEWRSFRIENFIGEING